ncbi:MAG: hypothetical protein DSY89_07855, partial [Deltaproteobacteria bacterium]
MKNDLIRAMKAAIAHMNRWVDHQPAKTVRLFHHNDSDGLSSGAILTRAFERRGLSVKRCCLEKTYPAVLKKIFEQTGQLIVFTDFAGRIAPWISDLNQGRNLVLILDHHKALPATDKRVYNLDPELFGLRGDRDITASVTCYLFTVAMDEKNRDLASIATIGAVGDGFFVDGQLAGPNREVALESQAQGNIEIKTDTTGEFYRLRTGRGWVPCKQIGVYLDTLGAAGYYRGGPEMGIRVCLEGVSDASDRMLAGLGTIQRTAFDREASRIAEDGMHGTPHIQWIHLGDRFAPMGVKMIGVFLSSIRKQVEGQSGLSPDKYLAGFQAVPDEVPGFGRVAIKQVKISMRVCASLADKIRAGDAPGMDTFLPEATRRVSGFSDA